MSPHEPVYQESSIQEHESEIREMESGIHELTEIFQERENEIRGIESGICELAEIFNDLSTLVDQQGGMLGAYTSFSSASSFCNVLADSIESISSNAVDTSEAAEELRIASEYQRKASRRAACLILISIVVVAIVLLAVSTLHLTELR
jgi:t-SNARE complex subunit (syntaxin)